MTPQAVTALQGAEVVVGYEAYFAWVADLVAGKECVALPLTAERARAELAVARAMGGQTVAVISSGDAGIYGMASLVLEVVEALPADAPRPETAVVPGVSAVNAAAALLGAPLGHDFAVLSLSDLLTPWPTIERRLEAAAAADFVVALLNPRSRRRDWQLQTACAILRRHRDGDTPAGLVRNAYRPGQSVVRTTLDRLPAAEVDMLTTVIVGNSQTRAGGSGLVTPRGYRDRGSWVVGRGAKEEGESAVGPGEAPDSVAPRPTTHDPRSSRAPDAILAESFRRIEAEVGPPPFDALEWPVARRMIHASGDVDLVRSIVFQRDPVAAGVRALRGGSPIVTDVSMVAAGLRRDALAALGTAVHCFIDDPGVRRRAEERGLTRSHCAMERAIAEVGDAVYVIGNAPTALAALTDAVRAGRVRPHLILALPVGFVGVVESKEQALALDLPVIAVRGRKGGSALAAAAVNALLLMAADDGVRVEGDEWRVEG